MFNLSRLLSPKTEQLAALDLGSNSFHLIIADWQDGELKIRDKVKEMVRLGWGLQDDGSLDAAAWNRAQACLDRFGERLREFKPGSVRVVGTKTLRSIIDSEVFLQAAQQRLGHPVEVISGEEEARLIYLGVAHYQAPTNGPRLVVDIGGGSTELALGEGMELKLKESLDMGCVAITKLFFKNGRVSKNRLEKANVYCSQQLFPAVEDYLDHGWQECLGASGTIKAVAKVCAENQFCDADIQLAGLEAILNCYLEAGECNLPLKGLSEERQPVFLGGVVVLHAIFQALNIDTMHAAESALREGLLYELKGRLEHTDIRPSSVQRLAERYHVDSQLSERVDNTCQLLLKQVAETWDLDELETSKLLTWASLLFLVGLDVAHNDYHKHGAYIVENVDLAGFSRIEQQHLAALVLAHRKRFPSKQFPLDNSALLKACLVLRLAVIFNRGKRRQALPEIQFRAAEQQMSLLLEQQWLQNNPLTRADLENEQQYLSQIDYNLDIIEL
ncbi:Ppx/GppA phosphatase family protein [Agarivorans gilvus]|uniref:Exopolyphosphatase n=1 Tax=Agarivorans gilvus TaxID=680279 RepID=A0ABQ1I1L7_9ALTE|nr:Ppx/GppA phosphatase family protein [Agarivorans gilvus]GGB07448.1 exopolyphosphatase [Agarivorans gilvus]